MQLNLQKPDLERYVRHQVEAGHFPTPEAVVEDALLRVMDEDIRLTDEDRAAIQLSEEQIDRGEGIDFADFKARMQEKYGTS